MATNAGWQAWDDVKRLDLNREALVGTSRNFKGKEGQRLPASEKRDYTYTRFEKEDYGQMIEAGMNAFGVATEQEEWVRGDAVGVRVRSELRDVAFGRCVA